MLIDKIEKSFIYKIYKKYKQKRIEKRKTGPHVFENRCKNRKTLVLILAGYKDFCKEVVFSRIKEFVPKDADVCIVSSGLYSKDLSKIAENNGWSYISCRINNVSRSVNICINEFKEAELIFKLDEDIFVTKNFFEKLLLTYNNCQKEDSLYEPTFIAPLIPINGFAHVKVLEKLGLTETYASKFEPVRVQAGAHRQIENNPDVAKFMWGEGGFVPQIDEIDKAFASQPYDIIPCPIKFSIGAILFSRRIWKQMGYFNPGRGVGMGRDESQICQFAMLESKPIIVSANTCVGHLSFGKQNATMKEYFLEHKDLFEIN